jgi:hypothetical protein
MQKQKMYEGLGQLVKEKMDELKAQDIAGLSASRPVSQPIQGQALGGDAQVQDPVSRSLFLDD